MKLKAVICVRICRTISRTAQYILVNYIHRVHILHADTHYRLCDSYTHCVCCGEPVRILEVVEFRRDLACRSEYQTGIRIGNELP